MKKLHAGIVNNEGHCAISLGIHDNKNSDHMNANYFRNDLSKSVDFYYTS